MIRLYRLGASGGDPKRVHDIVLRGIDLALQKEKEARLTGLFGPIFSLVRLGLLSLLCGFCFQFFGALPKIFGQPHEFKSARIIQREAIS
jgi:hypothetical protein